MPSTSPAISEPNRAGDLIRALPCRPDFIRAGCRPDFLAAPSSSPRPQTYRFAYRNMKNHSTRSLIHPRDEIMQMMQRIYGYRMTTTSGGNLSIREDNGDIWITPTRVDKGACVGRHRMRSARRFGRRAASALVGFPSIRRFTPRPDLRGIVHAHSVALVAFSISGQVPDTRLHQALASAVGRVRPYAHQAVRPLPKKIVGAFSQDSIAWSSKTTAWSWATRRWGVRAV